VKRGCDLLIFGAFKGAENQDQKIAAFGSSYMGLRYRRYRGSTGYNGAAGYEPM
jgi:hypothetical protein